MNLNKRLSCRLLALGVGCALVLLLITSVLGQSKVTLETITKAWKVRQDRVRSLRVVWMERVTMPKGCESDMTPPHPAARKRLGVSPGTPVPPNDITFDVPCTLVLDGGKVRYERKDREWSGEKQAYVPRPILVVFDGKVGKEFFPPCPPLRAWPRAEIESSNLLARPVDLIPLAVTFRPFDHQVCSAKFSKVQLTGRRSLVNGSSCLELEHRDRDSVRRILVDPTRDYVVVRAIDLHGERTVGSVSVEYHPDASAGWVPHTWNITHHYPKGGLRFSRQGKVTSYEINRAVASSEFVVDFPEGTMVYDMRDKSDYVVREGGRKRMILRDEARLTYDQLVNSDTGEALGNRPYWWLSWKLALSLVVLMITGGLLIWRNRRTGKCPA